MKSTIHTRYRAFARALESADAGGDMREIQGVFGYEDFVEFEGFAPSIAKKYLEECHDFRSGMQPGLLFVLVDMRHQHRKAGLGWSNYVQIIVDSDGRIREAFDLDDSGISNDLAHEIIGRDNPLWTLLSEYDTQVRETGDPSVNDLFQAIAGRVSQKDPRHPAKRLMAAVKRSIAKRRRSPTRFMTALRRMFQEEYDAAFPGDTEWELGDLGM